MSESLEQRIAQIENETVVTLEGQRFKVTGMTKETASRVKHDGSGVQERAVFDPATDNLLTLKSVDDPEKVTYTSIGELARHVRSGIASVEGIEL